MQITDTITDCTGQPLALTPIIWQPLAGAARTSAGVAIGSTAVITTDANGRFSSSIVAGKYQITIDGVTNIGQVVEDGSAFWTLAQVLGLVTPSVVTADSTTITADSNIVTADS